MSTEEARPAPVAIYTPPASDIGHPLWDPGIRKHMWQTAMMFAASQLVPAALQGKPEDCYLALSIAKMTHRNPIAVLQAIHIIKGKASWASSYLIACAKQAGMRILWDIERLEPLTTDLYDDNQKTVNKKAQPIRNYSITAWATVGSQRVEATITMQDAIDEGWTKNPKYFTMGETMLCYRTATRLVRLYMPELLHGLPSVEEVEAISPIEVVAAPVVARARKALDQATRALPEPAEEDPEVEDVNREAAEARTRESHRPPPDAKMAPDDLGMPS